MTTQQVSTLVLPAMSATFKRQNRRFFLPLIFHNAKGYDIHPLLQEVSKKKYGCKFDGIPNNSSEKLSASQSSHHHLVVPTQSE